MRAALIACVCAACGSGTRLSIDARCNPLGEHHCMTPWPASVFEVDDPTTATGRRVAIPRGTLPAAGDAELDAAGWNRADGFSPAAPIITSFKGGVSPEGLPPADNMDLSLATESATVLLDLTTGERVAHYAAADRHGDALLLYPARRLTPGHRYAVAITDRVKGANGDELDVPAGFAALRDGNVTDHHLLEAARPRLAEALEALAELGIDEDELVVAWDFTVASEDHALDAVRDRVLDTPAFDLAIEHAATRRDGTRVFTGALAAPLIAGGTHRIRWRALVPACGKCRVGMALYGHSLLADAREVEAQSALARRLCRALVAADLGGLSTRDEAALVRMLANLEDDAVFAALAQGMIDQVALAQAMRAELAATPLGKLVDPRDLIYYGASQHTGVLAHAPVARGIVTGGAPTTSHVLERYRDLLARTYARPLDATLVIALAQMRWDGLEAQPHKPVLLAGPADPATLWHARTLDLPLLAPAPFTAWGLSPASPDPGAASVAIPHTGVGIRDAITGYAPCCDGPACVQEPSPCSGLPHLP